jgi:hypothetical protein
MILLGINCSSQSSHTSNLYLGAGAYSKNFTDAFSGEGNVAALTSLDHFSTGLFAERRFMMKELSFYSIAAALPVSFGAIGINAKYYGYSLYNESQASIGYAKKLGRTNIGARFHYKLFRISGYGNRSGIMMELGSIFHATEKFHAGISLLNPLSLSNKNKQDESLPLALKSGFGYEASPNVLISLEFSKEAKRPINIAGMAQYRLAEKFLAKAGINTETNTIIFGGGWRFKDYQVQLLINHHPSLGFTPGILLLYQVEKAEQ